eukprot:scaffold25488_cov155-Skeletonema_dohrnii-CCMP3373.AAC.1
MMMQPPSIISSSRRRRSFRRVLNFAEQTGRGAVNVVWSFLSHRDGRNTIKSLITKYGPCPLAPLIFHQDFYVVVLNFAEQTGSGAVTGRSCRIGTVKIL